MSYVITAPETMATAATDLAGISATLSAAHLSAAVPTTALVPAAADTKCPRASPTCSPNMARISRR